jgi:hypothetical protein
MINSELIATQCDASFTQQPNMTYTFTNNQSLTSSSSVFEFGTLVTHTCDCGLQMTYHGVNVTSLSRSVCWGNLGWFPRSIPPCTAGTFPMFAQLTVYCITSMWCGSLLVFECSAQMVRHGRCELHYSVTHCFMVRGQQHCSCSKSLQKYHQWSWCHCWDQDFGYPWCSHSLGKCYVWIHSLHCTNHLVIHKLESRLD